MPQEWPKKWQKDKKKKKKDKEAKCPSIDKWIKKMWYIYTMEYYAAIRKTN